MSRLPARSARRAWLLPCAFTLVAAACTAGSDVAADSAPRGTDPIPTTATVSPQTTTTTVPGVPVLPGLDVRTAALVEETPHPGATILTEDTLTNEIIADLRTAVAATGYQEEPLQLNAAFEKDGIVYATVDYPSGEVGYLSAENGEVVRFRHGAEPWVDLHIIRKGSWIAFTQVSLIGLPDGAAIATLSTPERPDNIADQVVIGGAAFFEIGKPDWTQIGKLTVLDDEGKVVFNTEERLQGNSCSSYVVAPYTGDRDNLDPLEAGRVALRDAVNQCMPARIAGLAVGDGPYFGMGTESLTSELREADQRMALFKSMAFALSIGEPREVETENGTRYVSRWEIGPIEIDLPNGGSAYSEDTMTMELGFSEDGTWQYGILLDD